MRLGLVGCGNIAKFHVPAFKAAGFDIISVAGSPNSTRAPEFAKKYAISKVYSDPVELLKNSSEWDALLLASPVSTIVDYIQLAAPAGKPILVEKPVVLDHEQLKPIMQYQNVIVAYNRRFYPSTAYAKKFIDSHSNILIKVSIPERRVDPDHNAEFPARLPLLSYDNSVHLFDLINYLAGKVKWKAATAICGIDKYLAVIAMGEGSKGITVQLDSCFNSPDNFAVNILSKDERLEMRPIEIARYYRGMQVNEPTDKTPIRTYVPQLIEQVVSKDKDGIKPGFLEQAQDFMCFCQDSYECKGAVLEDAYAALEVAQSLIDCCK